VSTADLNQENGAVEVPHRPVIRVATPVVDPATDRRAGIVVISADAAYLFDLLAQIIGRDTEIIVANQDGDYVVNPDAAKTYGFDLGRRYRVQDDIPQLAPVFRSPGEAFVDFVTLPSGNDLAAAQRIAYDPRNPDRFFVLAAFVPDDDILGLIADERDKVVLLALVVVFGTALIVIVLARRLIRPVETITEAATRIASGERRIDLSALAARSDESGALARAFTAMIQEIDERERRMADQATELTRSNQDLSQFAYIASHDLQEPLRMVASYLDLLERRYGDRLDGDAREFIGYAVDGAARMKRLINDLLAYSRVGSAPLALEDVDSSEIVRGVIQTLSLQLAELHGQVTFDALPRVHADPVQLARVFQNLVENAIKYRSRAAPRVRIVAEPIESFWKFSVRDNGIGVDPRFSEKVFEIFKRLHGRDKYAGTGMGLAICRLVVERHGGRIWVEPRDNGGSVFSFTIPR
jgi:signal transduction histidine kinase